MATSPHVPPANQFNPVTASLAGQKSVEAKRLKKKAKSDTGALIRDVLISTLINGKPSDKLRAALELNRDLGVMRRDDREVTDASLDKGISLLSSTAPEPTSYLSSDDVARIRSIGSDNGAKDAPGQATDHPSSQEVPPVSGRVTLSPKFFSSPNQPNPSIDSRLDQLDARLNQLTAAVEKLLERTT